MNDKIVSLYLLTYFINIFCFIVSLILLDKMKDGFEDEMIISLVHENS